ncbi:VacJ family lipoprotein [Alteromonadaceae bacterium BrNp21-10]|nr:VacJ family lipoprotein [Alteromonadaceae bacterium BrNp21-10]
MKHAFLSVILLAVLTTGCASQPPLNQQIESQQVNAQQTEANMAAQPTTVPYSDPRDPLETVNRELWTFNWDVLDKHILRPVTMAYVTHTPNIMRKGLYNFALNLEEPANVINNLLQGKVSDSLTSLGRFALNSTFGLLGFIDLASDAGIERKSEDFGEVLGVWGIGQGPYLMLPAMGPSDVRNSAGDYIDSSYFTISDITLPITIFTAGIKALETRAALIAQEQLVYEAVDPYALVKDIYFQDQAYKVSDGKVEVSEKEVQQNEDIDAYLDQF